LPEIAEDRALVVTPPPAAAAAAYYGSNSITGSEA